MSKEKKNMVVPKFRFPEFTEYGDWEEKSIASVCSDTYSGGTPSTSQKDYYGGNIPFIRSAEIDKEDTELFLTSEGLKNSSAKLVNKGDVLVALYGANSGDVALAKIDGAINQAILCLKAGQSNSFIYQFLSFKKDWIVSKYIQGGQGNLSGEIVKSIVVLLPKPAEQQKIASCLSSLDELITAHTQKLNALKAHKKGLMQQLFPAEGEKVPKLRFEEFKESGEWEEKTLGSLGEFKNGINFSPNQKGSGILTVDVMNMYGFGIQMKFDELYRVNVEAKDYLLKDDDILFVRSSLKREGVGWPSLFKTFSEPVVFCGFLIRLRLDSSLSINSKFLLHYLRSTIGRNKIISVSGTGTITNVSQDSLKNIKAPFPKIEEQQKIATCLSSLDELITAQAEKIAQLKQHKKGLMQGLFPKINEEKP
jgi:type I restriction enzyme S subunit